MVTTETGVTDAAAAAAAAFQSLRGHEKLQGGRLVPEGEQGAMADSGSSDNDDNMVSGRLTGGSYHYDDDDSSGGEGAETHRGPTPSVAISDPVRAERGAAQSGSSGAGSAVGDVTPSVASVFEIPLSDPVRAERGAAQSGSSGAGSAVGDGGDLDAASSRGEGLSNTDSAQARYVRPAAEVAQERWRESELEAINVGRQAREEMEHVRPRVIVAGLKGSSVTYRQEPTAALLTGWSEERGYRAPCLIGVGSVLVLLRQNVVVTGVEREESCLYDHEAVPVRTSLLYGPEDIRRLGAQAGVPHADTLANSMRACEVFQSNEQGPALTSKDILLVGSLVYDADFRLGRGVSVRNPDVWDNLAKKQVYWCTAGIRLHKLPCEHRDIGASLVPAPPRLEICLSSILYAPLDADGRVEQHPADSLRRKMPRYVDLPAPETLEVASFEAGTTFEQLAATSSIPVDLIQYVVTSSTSCTRGSTATTIFNAGADRAISRVDIDCEHTQEQVRKESLAWCEEKKRGLVAPCASAREGTPCSEASAAFVEAQAALRNIPFPDYSIPDDAAALWEAWQIVSRDLGPHQHTLDILQGQQLLTGVSNWLARRACKDTLCKPLTTDTVESTTIAGLSRRAFVKLLQGAFGSVQFRRKQNVRPELWPASVDGGRSIRTKASMASSRPHTTVFSVELRVQNLHLPALAILKLPNADRPWRDEKTGVSLRFGCRDPSNLCAKNLCTCVVSIAEACIYGERSVLISGTVYKVGGVRGDAIPVAMDMTAPAAPGDSAASQPASNGSQSISPQSGNFSPLYASGGLPFLPQSSLPAVMGWVGCQPPPPQGEPPTIRVPDEGSAGGQGEVRVLGLVGVNSGAGGAGVKRKLGAAVIAARELNREVMLSAKQKGKEEANSLLEEARKLGQRKQQRLRDDAVAECETRMAIAEKKDRSTDKAPGGLS